MRAALGPLLVTMFALPGAAPRAARIVDERQGDTDRRRRDVVFVSQTVVAIHAGSHLD